MKTDSILKISATPASRKSKQPQKDKGSPALVAIKHDVNHLWEMYQAQLQRNGELMAIIDRQQQFIQQVVSKGAAIEIAPPLQSIPGNQPILLPEFKDLSVEMLSQYTALFRTIFESAIIRLDGIQNVIKLLYTLHHIQAPAFPDHLFESAKIAKSTGFRNIDFLKRNHLVKKIGTSRHDTKYKISDWGKQFIDGTLEKNYDAHLRSFRSHAEYMEAWHEFNNE